MKSGILLMGMVIVSGMAVGQTTASPAPPVVESAGGGVLAPVAIYTPEAPWPKGKGMSVPGLRADGKKVELSIKVDTIVGTNGLVRSAHIVHPQYPEFEASALKAVQSYRFKPAMKDGNPVAVRITVLVSFSQYVPR